VFLLAFDTWSIFITATVSAMRTIPTLRRAQHDSGDINPSLVGLAAWFPNGPAISSQVLVCANNFMAKVELEDPGRGGEVKLEAMDVRSLSGAVNVPKKVPRS